MRMQTVIQTSTRCNVSFEEMPAVWSHIGLGGQRKKVFRMQVIDDSKYIQVTYMSDICALYKTIDEEVIVIPYVVTAVDDKGNIEILTADDSGWFEVAAAEHHGFIRLFSLSIKEDVRYVRKMIFKSKIKLLFRKIKNLFTK